MLKLYSYDWGPLGGAVVVAHSLEEAAVLMDDYGSCPTNLNDIVVTEIETGVVIEFEGDPEAE